MDADPAAQHRYDENPDPAAGQTYVDRSKIDFDPEDGLYSGTAVEGTSEIPGPHERDEAGEEQAETDPAE